MSMYWMESLILMSVSLLAQEAPLHPERESLCHGLYVIEAKSGFDCDPTLFQAEEDLKALKYLYRIPLHRLPAEAQQYVIEVTDSGIPGISAVSDNLSCDEQTGECLVTASSPLWEKLVQSGVLPASADVRLRDMSALEIAEQIMPLAAGRLEKNPGDSLASSVLGYWYALFPLILAQDVHEYPPGASSRVLALRDLCRDDAVFSIAAEEAHLFYEYGEQDEDLQAFEARFPLVRQWFEPFMQWRQARRERFADTDFSRIYLYEHTAFFQQLCKKSVFDDEDWKDALDSLPPAERDVLIRLDVMEHTWYRVLTLPSTLLTESREELAESIADTDELYDKLIDLELLRSVEVRDGNTREALNLLERFCSEGLAALESCPESPYRRFDHAAFSLLTRTQLIESLPPDLPDRERIIERALPGCLSLSECLSVLEEARSMPGMEGAALRYLTLCRNLKGDADRADAAMRDLLRFLFDDDGTGLPLRYTEERRAILRRAVS